MSLALHKLDHHGHLLAPAAAQWRCLWSPRLSACFVALPGNAEQAAWLHTCRGLDLFGRHDWQLPTIAELQELVQRDQHSAMYDPRLFDQDPPPWCWSATSTAWSPLLGWTQQLDTGTTCAYPCDWRGGAVAILRNYRPPPNGLHIDAESPAPTMPPRMLRLDPAGRVLADLDTEAVHAAVYLPDHALIFGARPVGARAPQQQCAARCTTLDLCGWHDWHLPSVAQLQLLIDYRHYQPAVASGPLTIAPDWYWTDQPDGWEQALVGGLVDFEDGFVGYQERDYGGLALPVRHGHPLP